MNGSILGLGTFVPEHVMSQKDSLDLVQNLYQFNDSKRSYVKNLYENSGINKRHVVEPEFLKLLGKNSSPGMTIRNEIYKKNAHQLAENAARKALQKWGGDPKELTHIISVSCTGVVIPGLEFLMINRLGLNRSIYRLGINFMGCFGAFKGLHVANAFAKENPKNRILLICTELCSLHVQEDLESDSLVSNSLFADGSAAAVIGCDPKSHETPQWEIIKQHSMGLDNSLEQMTWEASDVGFLMKLSTYVPISIARHIKQFVEQFTTDFPSCDFAIHPGGKAILQVIEKKLKLEKSQTQSSWNVLENFGNMSSATFLFVLDELLKNPLNRKKETIGLGFGPGLSVEGIALIGY